MNKLRHTLTDVLEELIPKEKKQDLDESYGHMSCYASAYARAEKRLAYKNAQRQEAKKHEQTSKVKSQSDAGSSASQT